MLCSPFHQFCKWKCLLFETEFSNEIHALNGKGTLTKSTLYGALWHYEFVVLQ